MHFDKRSADHSLIKAAMWASKQPADRIAFQSAGAVPPQIAARRARQAFGKDLVANHPEHFIERPCDTEAE